MERQKTFKGDKDRENFIERLSLELGMSMVDLARKFDITPPAVSYAVQRGEKLAKEGGYQLVT